jgi:hypothetical protein
MDHWTARALVTSHQDDLRRQADDHRRASQAEPGHPARPGGLRSRFTEHVGHTLVEAGLHLLATATPRP